MKLIHSFGRLHAVELIVSLRHMTAVSADFVFVVHELVFPINESLSCNGFQIRLVASSYRAYRDTTSDVIHNRYDRGIFQRGDGV